MTEKPQIDVLVVGAGPTGLSLAGSLAKSGVRVRVIDKNSTRSNKSKALGVQAGTLESIEQIYGLEVVKNLVSSGFPVYGALFHFYQKRPINIELNRIPSKYNFILAIEQSETERILEEQLQHYKVKVGRLQKLISLSENKSRVSCEILHHDGEVEKIDASYIVGCDGAHSTVRQCLKVPFEGKIYASDFILGDVKVDWSWGYDAARAFVSGKGTMVCLPMRGEQRYRFILIPKSKSSTENTEITFDEFQKTASFLSQKPLHLSEPIWITRFQVHYRMTKSFRKGHVFLAGDAAHIHSPAGGQGMNTGIQDAFNLAHKFQMIFQGKEGESILDNYEKERMPVAKQVLRGTDLTSKLALLQESFLIRLFRKVALPILMRSRWIQYRMVCAMSEVKVARREIALRMQKKGNSL